MSPAEAHHLYGPEPDWRAQFDQAMAMTRAAGWTPWMIQCEAYERILEDWRRWRFAWRQGMRYRGAESDGVIALAKLGILSPRSYNLDGEDVPCKELQHDSHCWLTLRGSAWKIRAIEDKMLMLWRGWRPEVEYDSLDLSQYTPAQWARYCDKAVELLNAHLTYEVA